jgi:hypothetical protein
MATKIENKREAAEGRLFHLPLIIISSYEKFTIEIHFSHR